MDLTKKVFKRLEAGNHNIAVVDWKVDSLVTKNKEVWEHVNISVILDGIRPYNILLGDVALDINCNKLLEEYNLDESISQLEILDWMKGKEFKGFLEEKGTEEKTYFNWYFVSVE